MNGALCVGLPTSWWFPDSEKEEQYARGRAVCEQCAIQAECLERGLHEPDGMWGGFTPDERRLVAWSREVLVSDLPVAVGATAERTGQS